jgi:hypothetical protein
MEHTYKNYYERYFGALTAEFGDGMKKRNKNNFWGS